MNQSKNTKFLVIAGYGLIAGLAIFGIVWVYLELLRFSDAFEIPEERKELVLLSNTLATMYRAETNVGLLNVTTDPKISIEYDSLINDVFRQIDSLKIISQNSQENYLGSTLDSLEVLLLTKQKNMNAVIELTKSYETNTIREITSTTVMSRNDLDKLDSILVNNFRQSQDTSMIVGERKNFFQKLGDAFKTGQVDTLVKISSSSEVTTQGVEQPALKDTIIEFIQEVNEIALKKNAAIFTQLMQEQTKMYQINEQTTVQINQIMNELESKERENVLQILNIRAKTIERSSYIVSFIALAAIVVAILFMLRVLHSISVNQRLNREIEAGKKNVERLLASREQLIFSITHDIKVPVSSIIGYLELMSKDRLTSKVNYYIKNMQQSASHILDLVRNLLDLHSLDENRKKIDLLPFSPFILLRDICESFIPAVNKKGLKFEYYIEVDKDKNYLSDPYRIRQITENILSNAIKFTPQDGSVLLLAKALNNSDNTELHLSIKDTGLGIKEEDQERIFEEFERLDYSGNNIEGSGLGLSISNKLTHLLGGTIKIDSVFGRGSTFKIIIPLASLPVEKGILLNEIPTEEEEKPSVRMSMRQLVHSKKNKLRILFIDDDAIQLNLYSELLKQEGLKACVCSGSLEALQLLQNKHFDIIFSDIQMPDMNGFELVERIRMSNIKEMSQVPIVGLSANSQLDELKYKEAGFHDFLSKPFTPQQLFQMIYKYTGKGEEAVNMLPSKNKGFAALIEFAVDDPEAAESILRSFIEENKKNEKTLSDAFEQDDWITVKRISHKMLPLMRMISAKRIVHYLQDYEGGNQSKENQEALLNGIRKKIKEAENFLEENVMIQH